MRRNLPGPWAGMNLPLPAPADHAHGLLTFIEFHKIQWVMVVSVRWGGHIRPSPPAQTKGHKGTGNPRNKHVTWSFSEVLRVGIIAKAALRTHTYIEPSPFPPCLLVIFLRNPFQKVVSHQCCLRHAIPLAILDGQVIMVVTEPVGHFAPWLVTDWLVFDHLGAFPLLFSAFRDTCEVFADYLIILYRLV